MKVDVLIPTLNEELHIADAVASARMLGGDVFVLDSLSTDRTVELAQQAGAQVVSHRFAGSYSRQKNWALEQLKFTNDWVFILDADERITPALRDEILSMFPQQSPIDGYYVNRKLLIFGRQIRHGGLYPSWNLRLFRRGRARYEDRSVHEHMVCDGPTAYLRKPMLHVRVETITQFLAKHIRYADLESDEWVRNRFGEGKEASTDKLFRNALRWRQYLRRVAWPRTPCRPFIRWVYMYVVRLGFLDGRAGWQMAWLMANYEYMISILFREKLHARRQGQRTSKPG